MREARARGHRVIAVGTTTTRALETAAAGIGEVRAGAGTAELFIFPGHEFRAIDGLLTNFHLPKSSLLMLVAAFAGRDLDKAFSRVKRDLPVGIEVHQYSNEAEVVKRSIDEFMKTLLEAVVIVLAVSFFSLGFRTGLVVALCIPLVLAVTFLIMKLYGLDLQRISLGALIIALGLLVDDAIISVETMASKMEQVWSEPRPLRLPTPRRLSRCLPAPHHRRRVHSGRICRSSMGEYTFSILRGDHRPAGVVVAAVLFTPYLGYKLLPDLCTMRRPSRSNVSCGHHSPVASEPDSAADGCPSW
jgi:hypothetical protein